MGVSVGNDDSICSILRRCGGPCSAGIYDVRSMPNVVSIGCREMTASGMCVLSRSTKYLVLHPVSSRLSTSSSTHSGSIRTAPHSLAVVAEAVAARAAHSVARLPAFRRFQMRYLYVLSLNISLHHFYLVRLHQMLSR
jgi:hypothetical protein